MLEAVEEPPSKSVSQQGGADHELFTLLTLQIFCSSMRLTVKILCEARDTW